MMNEGEKIAYENSYDNLMKNLNEYWERARTQIQEHVAVLRHEIEQGRDEYKRFINTTRRAPTNLRNALKEAEEYLKEFRAERYELLKQVEGMDKDKLEVILKICETLQERDYL